MLHLHQVTQGTFTPKLSDMSDTQAALRARFDRIFTRKTGFVTLDRLLARLHANKHELLMVLDRPEIPLHTNGSENDIRCQVTKRKVSGGTRSDTGRDCRDAFLGLSKTCAKLGFAFWDYLGSRLAVPNQPEVPYLPAIVRHRPLTELIRGITSLSASWAQAVFSVSGRTTPAHEQKGK